MEQGELYIPPKPAGWIKPPGVLPMKQPPTYDTGQPQYSLYPATGPPPPAQVNNTSNFNDIHY